MERNIYPHNKLILPGKYEVAMVLNKFLFSEFMLYLVKERKYCIINYVYMYLYPYNIYVVFI